MFKYVNLIFFIVTIILPIVFCQSDETTTAENDQTTKETTTNAPIPTYQSPPKDFRSAVIRLIQSNNIIKNAELTPVATGVKILLTPVIFLVGGLLFVVKLLLDGVLFLVKVLVDGLVKSLGLSKLLDLLDPTLNSVTKLIDYLLNNVLCTLFSLSYIPPPFLKCPAELSI